MASDFVILEDNKLGAVGYGRSFINDDVVTFCVQWIDSDGPSDVELELAYMRNEYPISGGYLISEYNKGIVSSAEFRKFLGLPPKVKDD